MGNEINPAVWGLLGTLVGAAASVGTTWIANAHAAKLETQRAQEIRAETARAFQRQTLLELQEAVHILARKSSESFLHDMARLREGKEWGAVPVPNELDVSLMESFRTVGILNQRVSNEALRNKVGAFTETLADSVNAWSFDRATASRAAVIDEFGALSVSIGDCLRSNYEVI